MKHLLKVYLDRISDGSENDVGTTGVFGWHRYEAVPHLGYAHFVIRQKSQ